MRLLAIFKKTWRELLRDPWILGLTLAFAPFFVFLYWLWTQGGSTSYTVLVVSQDRGAQLSGSETWFASQEALEAIAAVQYADGKPLLKVRQVSDRAEVDALLRNRKAAAFLLIPADFSRAVAALRSGDRTATTQVTFGGDLTNPYYMVGATLAIGAVDTYIQETTGQFPLVRYLEEPLGASAARTEFENYVPGVMIFAVIMLIFLAAMAVAREVESGALKRLSITPMTSFDLLGGMTATMLIVGALSVAMTFATAQALGFRSQGPMWVAVLVGAVTSLSVIGMGMVVACFSRTVSQAFVIANFPLGLLMFFSGVIMPIPQPALFTLAGHPFGPCDILPPTHAVVALNKILTLGAGLPDVLYELTMLVVLSVGYFAAGVWLFKRMYLS
jgi:ABC-2 type transport system permease protein